jgi:hypothetical protein
MRFLVMLILGTASNAALAGYDLHITRKIHWADAGGPRISLAEWCSYAQQDKEIQHDRQNSENDFIVSAGGESFPLWYEPKLGELRTKGPSKRAVEKLRRIARHLKAKLHDGELYED